MSACKSAALAICTGMGRCAFIKVPYFMQNFELPHTTAMQFGYCILRASPHGLADRSLPQTPVASGLGHVEYHGFGAPYAAAHQSGFWQFAAEHNRIHAVVGGADM
jgi:hypothetical protein